MLGHVVGPLPGTFSHLEVGHGEGISGIRALLHLPGPDHLFEKMSSGYK